METTLKLGLPALLAQLGLLAQLQVQAASTTVPDSVVQIVAESDNLKPVPYASLPAHGSTYWEILPGGLTAPLPGPLFDPALPVYAITPTIFIVDSTFGEILVNPRQSAGLSPTAARTAAVNAEAEKVSNLISLVETSSSQAAVPQTQAMALTSGATIASGGTVSPDGQQQPQSGVPYLTIAPAGTNQYLVTLYITNSTASYDLQSTPVLANANYPWAWASIGVPGQTNYVVPGIYPNSFFRAILDTNAIPLWEAADPNNPALGALSISIDSPANGSTLH